jgi:hypothetical protein
MIQVTASGQTLPFANTDGLVYHLDASVGLTLDGNLVTGWEDKSGSGLEFTQDNASKQPKLVLNAFGGRPAINFDGDISGHAGGVGPNADELILGFSTSVRTFVAVTRLGSGNTNLAGIWGDEGADTGVRRSSATLWQGGTAPLSNTNDFAQTTGTMMVNGRLGGAVAENVPHVVLAQRSTNATFGDTSIGDYFFAGGTVAPRSFKGDIAEIMVFSRELSTQEQKELSVHLAAKYNAPGGGGMVAVGGVGAIGEQTFAGTQARYVRIHTDESGLPADTTSTDVNRFGFHISELEVFSEAQMVPIASAIDADGNLARSTKGASFATQIGEGGHGLDGNVINGILDESAAVWTRNPLKVDGNLVPGPVEGLLDLGGDRLVGTIRVWQRPNAVPERLRNFTVTVEDENHDVLQTFYYPGQVPGGAATFAQFDLDITTNVYTVGAKDILALEVSPLSETSDLLRIGVDGNGNGGTGILKLEPGASLAILNIDEETLFTAGQSFHILDFASVQGTFETISLPGGQSLWDVSELYTTGVITVVPEPSSAALLLGGVLFLGGRLRRRQQG